MTYAPVLVISLALWPILALLGGQGFSPLVTLAALPALAFVRPLYPDRSYSWLAILALAWIVLSAAWSPTSGPLVSGDLGEASFSVNAASMRLAITGLAILLVIAASLTLPDRDRAGPRRSVHVIACTAFAVLLATALLREPLLDAFYGADPARRQEGLQNATRNANAFAFLLPLLLAWLWSAQASLVGRLLAGLVAIASLGAFAQLGAQAALGSLALGLVSIGVVLWLPRRGYTVLFSMTATAPLLLGGSAWLLDRAGVGLPHSFQSRAWSWQLVVERIAERPYLGHGLEATGTWRETYAAHPDWLAQIVAQGGAEAAWRQFPVVPGHPHNMPLEIWADTGAIGAGLIACVLVFTGLRLPAPASLPMATRYAIAGLFGAVLSAFCFAYSVWNEAFWASVAMAVAALILVHRTRMRPP